MNHVGKSWAIDFFSVPTINFCVLHVLVIIKHSTREVVHFAVTSNPTMEWTVQQLREATPFGEQPKYLFRDNDKIFGAGVPHFLKSSGIKEVRIAYRCPWQNPFVERFIGTLRRELLDHVIVLSERHLQFLLKEFLEEYYHAERPHRSLDGNTPIPRSIPEEAPDPEKIMSIPILGGLHHRYEAA